jgi:ABC-2 type transport system permease protein
MNIENIKTLTAKEIGHYLNNPPAYILSSFFLLICGYFFAQPLFLINQGNLNSLNDIAPLILTFFIPALGMRLVAEERKTQTIEVLLTLPYSEEEIIISKYISAAIIITGGILLFFPYVLTLYFLSKPDTGHIFGSFLSLIILSLSFLSISLYSSTLSSSQITSFITGFAISFFFYLCGKITMFLPLAIQNFFSYLGIDMHLANLSRGVIDLKDLIYFFSIIFLFLYFSIIKIKSMRLK